MKCPACGNYPRPPTSLFYTFSGLRFKCQFCNEWLRGNAVMIFLDLLSA
ncbi:MAG: hypothetical protein GF418_10540, partial [Chitinivibrionales bacterium]|nr:hypothetical protein [Chitinivibrionales bacterium]MBD3396051.1 hypothetical protein [Chitinivibrionales bacterium]